jgi:hypothetical protein
MRFFFGFLFGVILGGLLAAALAAQRAAEPDDSSIFGGDEPQPPAVAT